MFTYKQSCHSTNAVCTLIFKFVKKLLFSRLNLTKHRAGRGRRRLRKRSCRVISGSGSSGPLHTRAKKNIRKTTVEIRFLCQVSNSRKEEKERNKKKRNVTLSHVHSLALSLHSSVSVTKFTHSSIYLSYLLTNYARLPQHANTNKFRDLACFTLTSFLPNRWSTTVLPLRHKGRTSLKELPKIL